MAEFETPQRVGSATFRKKLFGGRGVGSAKFKKLSGGNRVCFDLDPDLDVHKVYDGHGLGNIPNRFFLETWTIGLETIGLETPETQNASGFQAHPGDLHDTLEVQTQDASMDDPIGDLPTQLAGHDGDEQTLDVSLQDTIPYEHAIPDPSEPLEKKPRTKEVICVESSDDDWMNGGDLEYICGPGCAHLFEPHRNGLKPWPPQ